MKVLDPGHLYELDTLDHVSGWAEEFKQLRFVKRIGAKYPGNEPPGYEGTTTQEVLRALIDRTKYVDAQEHDNRNDAIIDRLRECLGLLELRAAERRGDMLAFQMLMLSSPQVLIEDLPVCDTCGHFACTKHDGVYIEEEGE